MFNKRRVAILLSQGISQTKVATIVGCSPALITQKLSDDAKLRDQEFVDLLADANASVDKLDAESVAIDAKYVQVEHALLDQAMVMAPAAELRDVTAMLRVMADRKSVINRQVPVLDRGVNPEHTVVVLQVPGHIQTYERPVIDITANKEVIAIGEQNLQPLGSQAVTKLFRKLSVSDNLINNEEVDYEPSTDVKGTGRGAEEAIPKASLPVKVTASFLQSDKLFAEC